MRWDRLARTLFNLAVDAAVLLITGLVAIDAVLTALKWLGAIDY